MSYATADDIRKWLDEDELIQLTDDDDTGSVDAAVVQNALDYATAAVDGYVGTRYSLPLSVVPPILVYYCADLAICALYDRRDTGRPEHWQARCRNADRFLGMVAAGKISLGTADPAGTGAADKVDVAGPNQIFPHSELDKY